MDPLYKPQGVEKRWQQTWEEEALYNADPDPTRESWVYCFPPPNVTGNLHLGHALQISLGDVLARWKRMQGLNVLVQAGYDHAGISTQNAVETFLVSEGTSRQELGREAFVARVWEWLHEYGGNIVGQFRSMGASIDYRRIRFTMDDAYVRAVMRWFVHLYERGWIYRDNRIINWCPHHQTSLSDLELEDVDMDDALTTIQYPLADGSGHVSIATVRPATILADVAVAVHPDDERYRDLIGKEVVVPFVERRVPVIADDRVEMEFGTGALKVTPGHDPTDFAIGRDHGLAELTVIGPDGRMNDAAGELAGLTQDEAAKRILEWASERGQIEKRESYRHSVPTCERCHSRIEPLISLQWWCRMDELKKPAIEALRERKVAFHPESQHRFAISSLEDAPDWNISRQIWWGHQLPVWYCPDGHVTVAETEPDACAECGSTELRRETDVLDTWFSSQLWPFATLGWPDETPDLAAFYPGDLQTTAREIIRLWENRMIFAGLELFGEVPFTDVIIHSTLLNSEGRRMSKSLGTGHRPGRDHLRARRRRAALRAAEDVLDAGRPFQHPADRGGAEAREQALEREPAAVDGRRRGARAAVGVGGGALDPRADRCDPGRARERSRASSTSRKRLARLYHLIFDDFCDWYLEAIKPRLGDEDVRATALAALERLLKLLHPVMPHVTEEIWTQLPARETRLIVAPWPEPTAVDGDFGALDRAQTAARIYRRSQVRIPLDGDALRIFEAVVRPSADAEQGDIEAERARLQKEIERAEKMLANEKFVANADPAAVEGEREKLAQYVAERDALG